MNISINNLDPTTVLVNDGKDAVGRYLQHRSRYTRRDRLSNSVTSCTVFWDDYDGLIYPETVEV